MDRDAIIRQIVARDMNGEHLTAEYAEQTDGELFTSACDAFGTWETALQYAGLRGTRTSYRQRYSADEVLQKIRHRCATNCPMTAKESEKHDRKLYLGAREHFGTWRDALRAAGVRVENLRMTERMKGWTKQELLDSLRTAHANGLPLAWTEACLQNRALVNSVESAFDSWRHALKAAGLANL